MFYDDAGNPVTAHLAGDASVSAVELPSLQTHPLETPTPLNPVGATDVEGSGTVLPTPVSVWTAVATARSNR